MSKGFGESDRAHWNHQAHDWKHDRRGLWGQFHEPMERLIRTLTQRSAEGLAPSDVVINLGSGSTSAQYFNDGIPGITSIDFSEEMLKLNEDPNRVLADLKKPLPLAPASVDLMTSFFLMRYLLPEEQESLLWEAYRVLKPKKGTLLIVDMPYSNYERQRAHFETAIMARIARMVGFSSVTERVVSLQGDKGDETDMGVLVASRQRIPNLKTWLAELV